MRMARVSWACPLLAIAVPVLGFLPSAHAELPRHSQQLLDKLEEFEAEERAEVEAEIQEKRKAVIEILRRQADDEAEKGNLDGALAIRTKIVELGGEAESTSMPKADDTPAASWEVPDDAELHRGDYYKVYPLAEPITWERARARCQAVGGELGWLDRDEDIEELRRWMQPVVDDKGHAPIWMGARKNEDGEWSWVNGKAVAENFWNEEFDARSGSEDDVMVRWIGGFRAAEPDDDRVIGYLCRWKR